MDCGYFQNKTNLTKLNIDIQGIILYYPLYNERYKMYTETQTDTKIVESKVELMQRINKLLEVMNTMQDNITELAKRVIELEKRDNGQR